MTRFDDISDVETLRQVAKLQAQENAALHARIVQLVEELSKLRGEAPARQLSLELEVLKERLAVLQKQAFGGSSEKREPKQIEKVAEQPQDRRGHGPVTQPLLPSVERSHVLEPEARTCPTCSGCMTEMKGQTEDSEEITVVERHFVLVKHRRQKYRCRCNSAVVTAPVPPKLIPAGRYSVEFAVDVAVAKYLDHLPLERQTRIMEREGLLVDSQTLWDQINALAGHLEPSYKALGEHVLRAEVLHADETWWRLMNRKASSKWWAWCLTSSDAVFYRILPSRSAAAGRQLLDGYNGVVVCDGYAAYDSLSRAGPGMVLAHCWAHVRRKFVEVESFFPEEASHVLDLIGRLYAVDSVAELRRDLDAEHRGAALELRRRFREAEVRPIVDEIREWAYQQQGLRESGLRKAVEYMLGLWPGLTRFLDDPRVPLDNNAVERALRGSVLGRKNHYGSRSERGTEVAAIFYSLTESAKLCGVDVKAYLLRATNGAIANSKATLLPHQFVS